MTVDSRRKRGYNFDSIRNIEATPIMKDAAKLFRALSNEHRLAIFEYLRRYELSCDDPAAGCTVGEIAKQYDLALSTVSHHLKELKEAGLIRCEQRGQFTYCVVNQEQVEELRAYFALEA